MANLLSHPTLRPELVIMKPEEGRTIMRSAKDLGRVLALAWLAPPTSFANGSMFGDGRYASDSCRSTTRSHCARVMACARCFPTRTRSIKHATPSTPAYFAVTASTQPGCASSANKSSPSRSIR